MSITDARLSEAVAKADTKEAKDIDPQIKIEPAQYFPTDLEVKVRGQILNDFTLGYQTMYRPRQEFNDLSVLQRDQVDSLAFNTFQPSNGENAEGDVANAWRSNAIRPIERNKAISMAGHAAGRLGFLRLQATDNEARPDDDAAMVVNSAMDWVNATYFPKEFWLHAILQSEASPACIVHHEFRQVFRQTKTTRNADGSWNMKPMLDEANSGFMATIVPTDQIYIENIFEKDLQKQRFVLWRRVQSHDQLDAKYRGRKNWDKVRKGMQLLFNDANQGFYFAYDPNLRGELGEEIMYWTKADGGSFVTMVNGVVIGEADAKNPREDGLFPFAKWFYSWIRDNFFYGKSLVFAVSHDANIINTLYPVLVDGAILDTMKPTKYIGKDTIGSDVIIPGATVTMRDPNSKLEPLLPPMQTGNLLTAMQEVEKSLDQTANTQATPANRPGGITAYEMSLRDQQVQQDLGPFYSELIGASVQMTRLVMGDVLQYMTVADVNQMQGAKAGLKYKSFLVDLKSGDNKAKRRRVKFEPIGDEMADPAKALAASYDILEEQGGLNAETEIVKADPVRIRALKYSMMMTDDVLQPKSESVRFKQNLEMLDQIIKTEQVRPGLNNMEAVVKKLLYSTNPITARDPESFVGQPNPQAQPTPPSAQMPPQMPQTPPQPQPAF
jgi:hypothetical protein